MSPRCCRQRRPKARFGACLWRQGGGLCPSVSRVTPSRPARKLDGFRMGSERVTQRFRLAACDAPSIPRQNLHHSAYMNSARKPKGQTA